MLEIEQEAGRQEVEGGRGRGWSLFCGFQKPGHPKPYPRREAREFMPACSVLCCVHAVGFGREIVVLLSASSDVPPRCVMMPSRFAAHFSLTPPPINHTHRTA